jgi:hypothetical protein
LIRYVVQPPAAMRRAPYAAIAAVVVAVVLLMPAPKQAAPAEVSCTRASNRCVIGQVEYRADELSKVETSDEPAETCPALSLTLTFDSGALKQLQYVGKSCDRSAVLRASADLQRFRARELDDVHSSFPRAQPARRTAYLLPLAFGALLACIAAWILRKSATVTIDRENGDLLLIKHWGGTTLKKHLQLHEVKDVRVVRGDIRYRVEVLYGGEWEPLELELTLDSAQELAKLISERSRGTERR